MNPYEQYMHELAQQMRSELTDNGFTSLESSEDVSNYMNNVKDDETTFVVINSTCGCAAGLARPAAVAVADQNDKKPTHKVTVFAAVSYTHLTLPTNSVWCRSRWSPYH